MDTEIEALRLPDGRALRLYRRPGAAPTTGLASGRGAESWPDAHAQQHQLRRDPLRGEWVAYAADRQDRTHLPERGACPFCPAPPGEPATELPHGDFEVAVLDNRFAGLRPPHGRCEVVVYGPEHEGSFAELATRRASTIVHAWRDRYRELGARSEIGYVLCFENRGEAVGVTLHHPHGQVYAFGFLPPVPAAERAADARAGGCAVCAALAQELADGRRLVDDGASTVAYVPRAARWPYEVHVTARRHRASLAELDDDELDELAGALQRVLRGYDALADAPLPYVLAVHQAPTDGAGDGHLHVEITTPYRAPGRRKHLAGVELAAGTYLVDALPERTAAELAEAVGRGH